MYTCYPVDINFGDFTQDIYPNKFCKIQVARCNFCYYEIHPLGNTLYIISIMQFFHW